MKSFNNKNFYNNEIIIFLIFYLTILIGFFFNEDSLGGARHDFSFHFEISKNFNENFFLTFLNFTNIENFLPTRNSPVFWSIFSILNKIFNLDILRLINSLVSILIAIYFFKCLELKFKHQKLLHIFLDAGNWDYINHSNYLNNQELIKEFYDALEIYNLTLSLSLSNPDFMLNTSIQLINKYKNDSKYFSGLKSYLNKDNDITIVNTYKFYEHEEFDVIEDNTFDDFENNHVIYLKYGKINKFGYSSSSDTYEFGDSFDIMFYDPSKIKLFNFGFMLAYSFNISNIPATNDGQDLKIQKINLHLLKYLERLPLYIDFGLGPSSINDNNLGINFEFILSYYIPVKTLDLSFSLSYEQYIDIKENLDFDFGNLDLLGVNISIGKSIIIK